MRAAVDATQSALQDASQLPANEPFSSRELALAIDVTDAVGLSADEFDEVDNDKVASLVGFTPRSSGTLPADVTLFIAATGDQAPMSRFSAYDCVEFVVESQEEPESVACPQPAEEVAMRKAAVRLQLARG
jgi:hypothetical protein